jgi:hypothetical protein
VSEDTCENDDEMVDVVDDDVVDDDESDYFGPSSRREGSTCFRPLLHPMPRKIIKLPACEFISEESRSFEHVHFCDILLSEMRIFLLTHEHVQ